MSDLNSLFGIHEQALLVSSQRAALIANNIVNVDTPGYRAKDLDFKQILKNYTDTSADQLRTDRPNHLSSSMDYEFSGAVKYRMVQQASADDNTVDINQEKSEFAANSMRWLASYTFLNGEIKTLRSAFRSD